jgi:hypothetical protein
MRQHTQNLTLHAVDLSSAKRLDGSHQVLMRLVTNRGNLDLSLGPLHAAAMGTALTEYAADAALH